MIKRAICGGIAALSIAALAACGQSSAASNTEPAATTSQSAPAGAPAVPNKHTLSAQDAAARAGCSSVTVVPKNPTAMKVGPDPTSDVTCTAPSGVRLHITAWASKGNRQQAETAMKSLLSGFLASDADLMLASGGNLLLFEDNQVQTTLSTAQAAIRTAARTLRLDVWEMHGSAG